MMNGIAASIGGALGMAAASTFGDFIWATWISRHRMVYGLAHGTLLFFCMGLCLGVDTGKPMSGALGGTLIGLTAAASFYVLSPYAGYSVMFFIWIALWGGLAAMYSRLRNDRTSTGVIVGRGTAAALLSGLGFYAISGIWRPFHPHGWDYAVHFLSWTVAFLPGFAALMVGRSDPSQSSTLARPASR